MANDKMDINKIDEQALKMFMTLMGSLVPGLEVTMIISDHSTNNCNYRIATNVDQVPFVTMLERIASKTANRANEKVSPEIEVRTKVSCIPVNGQGLDINDIKVMCVFPPGVKAAMYDGSDNLTSDGLKLSTTILASGIASNIHYGHQKHVLDSAKHLRYAIEVLEDRFATVAEIQTNTDWRKF
ncbi:hypothetical protein [Mucilaginibacter sp.]|uniref:hypothetical protein n=1 Tax=Mucilaginibacter sp. TaxID=1882438 RepID=UPI0035BBE17C